MLRPSCDDSHRHRDQAERKRADLRRPHGAALRLQPDSPITRRLAP